MEKAIPFWEEAYRSDNIMAFSIEPNKTVTEYEHLLNKDAAVWKRAAVKVKMFCTWRNRAFIISSLLIFRRRVLPS